MSIIHEELNSYRHRLADGTAVIGRLRCLLTSLPDSLIDDLLPSTG